MLFHNLGGEAEEDVLGSGVQRRDRATHEISHTKDRMTASLRMLWTVPAQVSF